MMLSTVSEKGPPTSFRNGAPARWAVTAVSATALKPAAAREKIRMKTSDTGGLSGIGGARLQPDIIQFHEPNLGLERLLFRPARGIAFFMERQQCVCTNRFVAR